MTDDLRARIAAALATCQGATTWAAMADAVMPEVQPIADDLATAEQHIEAGNTATLNAYAQLRTAKAELTENEGVVKALRRQRDEAEAAVERVREWLSEWGPRLPDGACHALNAALDGPPERSTAAAIDETYRYDPETPATLRP